MRFRYSHHRLLLVAALLVALAATARRHLRWDDEAMSRKADYIYLEAVNAGLRDDDASRYELLSYAYAVDSTDIETGNEYALYLMHLNQDDSLAQQKGLGLMKRYFDRHPEDLYHALTYALTNQNAGNDAEALRTFAIIHALHPERPGVTYRYADLLSQSGTPQAIDSAMAVYDSLEIANGPSMDLTAARMRVLFMRQDTVSILNEARRFYNSAPQSVENNMFMGDVCSTFGLNDSALVYFNRACDIDPTNAPAFYSRAVFYHQTGDSAAFDREIFKVLKMDNLDMQMKMNVMRNYVAELYEDRNQIPRILDLFNELIELHPHDSDLRRFYGSYLYMIDRYGEAADQLERALDLEPSQEDLWITLVSLLSKADRNDEAISSATRGMHFFPGSHKFHAMRGAVYVDMGRVDDALDDMREAIALCDTTDLNELSDLHCWLGDIFYMKELPDSAITEYREAIFLNPLNELALNNCAYFLAENDGDLDEALKYIERALAQADPEPELSWIDTYAWVMFKRKDYEKAREQIDILLQKSDEPDADAYRHAGDIYYFVGEPRKALDFWEKALKLDPDDKLLQKKVKNKAYYYE